MKPRRGVSRGRLRVDAARAVAKLREFQLADPNAWLQEAVRGAVALGATTVHADGDADDIFLSWDGGLVPAATLPRLFDELVSPSGGARGRGLRLLATGVNASLGVSPEWVKLYRCTKDECHSVTYSPELLLDVDGDGKSALSELQLESCKRPERAPASGMLLHFRRRLSAQVMRSFVTGSEAGELRALRLAADDSALPIRVGAGTSDRGRSSQDLLRVELGEGLDGFLALTRVGQTPTNPQQPMLVAAELGVHVVSRAAGFIEDVLARAHAPLRLFINAPRMPTNAARSDVRTGEAPLADALRRARDILPMLVERLIEGLDEGGASWRRAALALLAFAVAGYDFRDRLRSDLPNGLEKLLDAPLLLDATGASLTPREVANGEELAHLGAEPVDPELRDLVKGIPWLPAGDPGWLLLGGSRPEPATERVEEAYRRRAARLEWLERSPRDAPLVTDGEVWTQLTLEAPGLPGSARLTLCLTSGKEWGVSLRSGGREVERARLNLGFGISATLDYEELRPDATYEGARHDVVYRRALDWATLGVLFACDELASAVLAASPKDANTWDAMSRTLRLGIGELGRQRRTSQIRGQLAARLAALDDGALMQAKVWPRPHGAHASTAEVLRSLESGQRWVLCDSRFTAPEGVDAELLSLDAASADALSCVMSGRHQQLERRLLRYVPKAARGSRARVLDAAREALMHGHVALVVEEQNRRGAVAWGVEESFIAWRHQGQSLDGTSRETGLLPAFFVVDDDRALPDEQWKRVVIPAPLDGLDAWERSLACAVADSLIGEAPDALKFRRPGGASGDGVSFSLLLQALARCESPRELLGEERFLSLLDAPQIPLLGDSALASIHEWGRLFPTGPLPFVFGSESAGPRVTGYRPALLSPELAEAAARLIGREAENASGTLRGRRLREEREAGEAMLMARPAVALEPPADPPYVKLRRGAVQGYLSLCGVLPPKTEVRVLGRSLTTFLDAAGLPVRVVLDGDLSIADDEVHGVRKGFRSQSVLIILEGAGRLLLHIAQTAPETFTTDPQVSALLRGWLEHTDGTEATLESLRGEPFLPSVQGELISLKQATYRGRVRYARYAETWLPRAEGSKKSSLDRPILRVMVPANSPRYGAVGRALGRKPTASKRDSSEFEAMLALLAGGLPLTDSTRSVRKIQARRRVAAGTIAKPRLLDASPELIFDLEDLGSGGKDLVSALGPGVAALVAAPGAQLRLCSDGDEQMVLRGEMHPSVEVAVEAPALIEKQQKSGVTNQLDARLLRHLGRAAALLVAATLRRTKGTLPGWLEPSLRAGIATGTLSGAILSQPLYDTTDGRRLSFKALEIQVSQFGALWVTTDMGCDRECMEQGRVAVRLDLDEARLLGEHLRLEDAAPMLAREAVLRRSLAQAPLAEFAASDREREGILALRRIATTKRGVSGLVAVLKPSCADQRELRMFREMRVLETWDDPCVWPTLAWLNDPELEPMSADGSTREELRSLVQKASEAAMEELIQPPPEARFLRRITPSLVKKLLNDGSELRGVFWLDTSSSPGQVRVTSPAVNRDLQVRSARGEALPISGRCLTMAAGVTSVHASINTLAARLVPILLGELATETAASLAQTSPESWRDFDTVLALLASSALSGQLEPESLAELPLPCVTPAGLPMQTLASWRSRQVKLEVVSQSQAADGSRMASAIIDDGSELSRTLIAAFGRIDGAGADRNTYFVICERVSRLLQRAGVDSSWLPLRPRELRSSSLLRVAAVQGTLLNEAAKPVRELAHAMDAGAPNASRALKQLALHAWMIWRQSLPEDTEPDYQQSLRLLLAVCDEEDKG